MQTVTRRRTRTGKRPERRTPCPAPPVPESLEETRGSAVAFVTICRQGALHIRGPVGGDLSDLIRLPFSLLDECSLEPPAAEAAGGPGNGGARAPLVRLRPHG
jgi:hypothetical protein